MLPVLPCLGSASALKFKMQWMMQDFCLVCQYAFLLRMELVLFETCLKAGLCFPLGLQSPVVQPIASVTILTDLLWYCNVYWCVYKTIVNINSLSRALIKSKNLWSYLQYVRLEVPTAWILLRSCFYQMLCPIMLHSIASHRSIRTCLCLQSYMTCHLGRYILSYIFY
jgi:hypothetical protein